MVVVSVSPLIVSLLLRLNGGCECRVGMRLLVGLLEDPDAEVASETLRVLFNMSTVDENRTACRLLRGVPLVIPYLGHPSVDVQRNAIKALYALSIDGTPLRHSPLICHRVCRLMHVIVCVYACVLLYVWFRRQMRMSWRLVPRVVSRPWWAVWPARIWRSAAVQSAASATCPSTTPTRP